MINWAGTLTLTILTIVNWKLENFVGQPLNRSITIPLHNTDTEHYRTNRFALFPHLPYDGNFRYLPLILSLSLILFSYLFWHYLLCIPSLMVLFLTLISQSHWLTCRGLVAALQKSRCLMFSSCTCAILATVVWRKMDSRPCTRASLK